jgi:cyanophycinase-like exopeptidase
MTSIRLHILALTALLLVGCGGGSTPQPPVPAATYRYFAEGAPAQIVNVPTPAEPSTVIMGGGPDVDSAFRWMIERSGVRPGTGGRFVIIRASGTEAYNPYIYYSNQALTTSATVAPEWVGGASMGLSSVETLVIPDREAANHAFVNEVVGRAQAVFIAGGDQSDYIRYWKNTALHTTLDSLMQRNVPIGGTSAGLAVLGQFDFSAMVDGVLTSEAFADPYNEFMTLDPDPLSLTGGFLTPPAFRNAILDSHLNTRDRMGRMLTFVSRLVAQVGATGCTGGILSAGTSPRNGARAIGVGVETALLVQGNGLQTPFEGRRVSNPYTTETDNAVYFVRPLQAATVCSPGMPFTAQQFEIRKLNDAGVFNLSDWSGKPAYTVDVNAGVLSANPY